MAAGDSPPSHADVWELKPPDHVVCCSIAFRAVVSSCTSFLLIYTPLHVCKRVAGISVQQQFGIALGSSGYRHRSVPKTAPAHANFSSHSPSPSSIDQSCCREPPPSLRRGTLVLRRTLSLLKSQSFQPALEVISFQRENAKASAGEHERYRWSLPRSKLRLLAPRPVEEGTRVPQPVERMKCERRATPKAATHVCRRPAPARLQTGSPPPRTWAQGAAASLTVRQYSDAVLQK